MMLEREMRVVRRRILQAVPIVLGIMLMNFLLLHLAPGDFVDIIAGTGAARSDPEFLAKLRSLYGLDQALPLQFAHYVWRLVHFDLGWSLLQGAAVTDLILSRLWPTLLLVSASIVLAFLGGLVLGVAASRRVHGIADGAISATSTLLYAMPNFWLALMLILVFSVKLGWLPVAGYATPGLAGGTLARAWDVLTHLLLPLISLSAIFLAIYARLMRTSMLEVLSLDFIETARAKGLTERQVAYRHALRNALLPMITFAGLQSANLLGGAVVVEMVFAWPGMGMLALQAVMNRDYNLILGILFISALIVVAINLLVDLVYARLDPRIELQ